MKVSINGEERIVADGATVDVLLSDLGAPEHGIAVARNDAVVRRSAYAREMLADGDRLEIIRAVAGG